MRRKTNRLDLKLYQGEKVYFVTSTTQVKRPVFLSTHLVSFHEDVLKKYSLKHGFEVIVFCFMPDHLHLLLAGAAEQSYLTRFVKDYKQNTGFAYRRETGLNLWQKSYYDHILRKDEIIERVAWYILENPVRRNLVEKPEDYPFSGSLVYGREIFNLSACNYGSGNLQNYKKSVAETLRFP